ncbi:MAG: hypothetical protein IT385_30250 [Deltaproteobacteria bacterium]|nr:hypothetical protein [Deltaproteobacteria bacterium]
MRLEADRGVAYRLHLLGLDEAAFEVQPAYRRTELKLRPKVPRGLVAWATVDEALAASEVPDADEAWFERRWQAGERELHAQLAAAMDALVRDDGWAAALAPDVRVVVSPAVRGVPALAPATRTVAVGPDTPPTLVGLGVVALVHDFERAIPLDVPAPTRRFTALMAAGTRALDHVRGAALDALLEDVTRHLLPPQHRADELAAHVHALERRGLLDQPIGEIDRTIHGLGRRRADRVHRAWQRGFFLVRGGAAPAP